MGLDQPEDIVCSTGLFLGSGHQGNTPERFLNSKNMISGNQQRPSRGNSDFDGDRSPSVAAIAPLDMSLTLGLACGGGFPAEADVKRAEKEVPTSHQMSSQSTGSSFSGANHEITSIKRERDHHAVWEDAELERLSSRASDEDDDGCARKKLRLTKEQSALLEDNFKEHSTLNPKQKLALAMRLNLRPRQVEVWFQNRRARTKLKQTEVDCEFLKRCCEAIKEENKRLQREIHELKTLKSGSPGYMHMQAATLTMCPSCEKIGAGQSKSTRGPFAVTPRSQHA